MNALQKARRNAAAAMGAAGLMAMVVVAGCSKAPAPPPAKAAAVAAAKTNAPEAAVSAPASAQSLSVFEDLPPDKGKDPFFPMSHRREPAAPVASGAVKAHVEPALVIKGIVGSINHRIVVINNEMMQVGEQSPIRVPGGGRVNVKCLEIGQDYAVVQVEGEPQPKKLVMEQKK